MYNNKITYHKKWDTKENLEYNKKLKGFIDRADCCSDVPLAWSKEIYELMVEIDKEYGIEYSTGTYYGYRYQGSIPQMLFVLPFTNLFKKTPEHLKEYLPKTLIGRVWRKINGFKLSVENGIKASIRLIFCRTINKFKKPRVSLGQVKEKYGHLTVYFNADNDYIDQHVNDLICKAEIKIAAKGASYPVESLYYHGSSWYDKTHTWEAKRGSYKDTEGKMVFYTNTKQFKHRKLLEEMGYNLKDLKALADRRNRNAKRKAARQASNNSKKRP